MKTIRMAAERFRTYPRRIFYLRISMPNAGQRGCRVPARRVRITIFQTEAELNRFSRRHRLYPKSRWVRGLAVNFRYGPTVSRIYLCRDAWAPGVVAHELAHALLFVAREDLRLKTIYGRGGVRRSGPKRGFRTATEKEEWFCGALEKMVGQVLANAGA